MKKFIAFIIAVLCALAGFGLYELCTNSYKDLPETDSVMIAEDTLVQDTIFVEDSIEVDTLF